MAAQKCEPPWYVSGIARVSVAKGEMAGMTTREMGRNQITEGVNFALCTLIPKHG